LTGPPDDLTGDWTGIFNYPRLLPSTPFEATLRDHVGLISGVTTEPDLMPGGRGDTLHAVIEGRREGGLVHFTKTYDDLSLVPDVVHYEGHVDPSGDEIAGRWTIPGEWSGTFLMIRASGAKAEETLRTEEEVPAKT
jgi:hypothetical protein